MQLMFLDKINKDSYKPEVVSFFRVTVRIALLRVSLAIAFRWAWIQANPVRCAIRLGLDPKEAMWTLFAPPRAVAVQSPLHPRSSLPIPRSCERAGGVIQERLHSGALDASCWRETLEG